MGKLSGRTAIVTGGASGIGAGIARAFGEAGANVAVVDIVPAEQVSALMAVLCDNGRKGIYVHADVADEEQVRHMVDVIVADFDHIDILVNNAGIPGQALLVDLDVAAWDRVIAVNLRGPFLCSKFALPHMLARGCGRIINLASNLGQIGGKEMVHYSASKGGVIAFTKALAREVAHQGILVNAIAPGPTHTDMLASETDEWKREKLAELPIGRFATIDEIAPTAVFLASDDATYYIGQTLGPNGGDVML